MGPSKWFAIPLRARTDYKGAFLFSPLHFQMIFLNICTVVLVQTVHILVVKVFTLILCLGIRDMAELREQGEGHDPLCF